ncbi:MAG: alpha/beta hydrolase [Ktedonobacteraceae bacterium]
MPIQPFDGFTTAHRLQLHYRRWSPPEPDPQLSPILLLHGLASATRIWDSVAPLLAERGYLVIALDQRGHGESDKPDSGYDFATIVEDDTIALRSLGIARPVVVGHSWGASVALQYAVTHGDNVTALVLVDGATNQLSLRPNWSREQAIKDLAPPRFAGTPRETFLAYYRSGPLGQQWTPELEESVLHIVQLREDKTVAPRLDYENHLQIIGAMWDQPLFDLYRRVRCPIKLIVAEQQPAGETHAAFLQMRRQGIEQLSALRPDIRVVWMPDTIHDIPLHRPAQLAEEIVSYAPSQT